MRIFHQYRPRQVARYVKVFFRGQLYIDGIGAFDFDGGRLLTPSSRDKKALVVMAEVNGQIKVLLEQAA